MHSDPIADLLTRIRNGSRARMDSVEAPHSTVKLQILKILQEEGFIKGFEVTQDSKFPKIRIDLRFDSRRRPIIHGLKRVSTPGLRVYRGASELRPVRSGLSTRIVSTNLGVMTDREARKRGVGGEVVCEVW
ncbi:MAG: 30S ribosomal protein S8 [Fimbriimonadaceae bacterium]